MTRNPGRLYGSARTSSTRATPTRTSPARPAPTQPARRSHPAAALITAAGLVAAISVVLLAVQLVGRLTGDQPEGESTAHAAAGASTNSAAGASTNSATVRVDTPDYWSWAMLDRSSGRLVGSANLTATNSTESMVKVWIVADYLRSQAARGLQPPSDMLELASSAIRDSDDHAAEILYRDDGSDAVIRRLIATCGLTDTSVYPAWWSRTQMSARDAVRMGACVADGRAAGPRWTNWLLNEMRHVRGSTAAKDQPDGGRWGIIDALQPKLAATVAIKNGWTPIGADGAWHLNCLAIADSWILAVEARYPISLGLDHGAGVCRTVAAQVISQQRSN